MSLEFGDGPRSATTRPTHGQRAGRRTPTAPSVTVLIPTHNASRFIREALESLFAQSRPPDEIVVVDDGSTDDTFDRISPYLPHIIYHREQRRGVAGGGAHARGPPRRRAAAPPCVRA